MENKIVNILVIFGATGDLASRKIFPAINEINKSGNIPENFHIIGCGRKEIKTNIFNDLSSDLSEKSKYLKLDPLVGNDYKALAKNPQSFLPEGWYLGKPSESDYNVMIAEEKVIQKAVYASIDFNEAKAEVEASIQEKTKDLQKLLSLTTTTVKYAATWEGMAEHQPLMDEIDKILINNEEIKIKQNQKNQLRN